MSPVRDLIFRPLPVQSAPVTSFGAAAAASDVAPAQAFGVARAQVSDAAPVGVPHDAEHLRGDGLEGWRWLAASASPLPAAPAGWHVARLPTTVLEASLPFVVTDVDSTLIRQEVIELLAAHAGREAEVAAVTEQAMRGELDFAQSLHARVEALAGLPVSVIDDVVARVEPTAGALDLISAVSAVGGRVCAVSGGFTQVLAPLAQRWGLHAFSANELEVEGGRLTGRVVGDVVDRAAKAAMLRRWTGEAGTSAGAAVGVGDGANDIDLLRAAGCGVALCAKPVLREVADVRVDVPSLTPVRWLLGL